MKRIVFLFILVLPVLAFAQTAEPDIMPADFIEFKNWIKTGQFTFTYKTFTSPTITSPTITGATLSGATSVTGSASFSSTALFLGAITEAANVTAIQDTFATGATADTVLISGLLDTDMYHFTWTSDPGAPQDEWVTAKEDTVIVTCGAAVTGTPTYNLIRRKVQ